MVRVFVNEGDRHEGMPMHEWIVLKARETGAEAAAAFRGLAGFGERGRVCRASATRLIPRNPVVVELIGRREKLEVLLRSLDGVIKGGVSVAWEQDLQIFRWKRAT